MLLIPNLLIFESYFLGICFVMLIALNKFKEIKMKKLLATTLLFASTPLLAHSINTDSCDVELNANVKINEQLIEFKRNDRNLYRIEGASTLVVDGEEVALSADQTALVTDYANSIRAVVPEVRTIALEGIALATEGVNLAFNELLGEGNRIGADLTEELTYLSEEIEHKLSVNRGIEFNEDGFVGDDFLGEEFEQRIERTVEKAVENSMGTLLIAVGQELLMSGGDMDAFETRMENFGEQIEFQMETRAEALEHKADEMCGSIVEIDILETRLQHSVAELADINVIEVTQGTKDKA